MRRHARVVVLLGGWLLMMAPFDAKRPEDAPIARWVQLSAHDTAAACEEDRATTILEQNRQELAALNQGAQVRARDGAYFRCVPAESVNPPKSEPPAQKQK